MVKSGLDAWLLIQAHKDKCVICGEDRAAALDFHHVDPATKSFNLGSAAKSKSVDAVLREIAKCIVVCSRCHRLIHAGEIGLEDIDHAHDEEHRIQRERYCSP